MKQIFLVICVAMELISCNRDKFEPIGMGGDIIQFSTTKLSFDANAGTDTITSVGNWWWILHPIYIDDDFGIDRGSDGNWYLYGKTEGGEYENLGVAEVTVDSENFIINIIGPWFTITKETAQKITFSVLPNDTGKDRKLVVPIEAGNYFTSITVNQTAN